jgi:adenylyltransferase/sulfurtransferase
MAAAGVGTIGLIDDDSVDISNLQRQIIFDSADRGTKKTSAAKKRLAQLNPEIEIRTYEERLTHHNAGAILGHYDLVIDGTDNFVTKFLINDAAYKYKIPTVYAAVNGFEAQVALFDGHHGACYRCFLPTVPLANIRNCAEAGVLGPIVGTAGTMQATLALQYLISQGNTAHQLCPQIGQLTLLDLNGAWSIRSIKIEKRLDCATCSHPTEDIKLESQSEFCSSSNTITAQQLHELIESNKKFILIDVRELDEWNSGHLPNARHFALSRIQKGEFPEHKPDNTLIVAYCKSGQRSNLAVNFLTKKGFEALNLAGGILGWPGVLIN